MKKIIFVILLLFLFTSNHYSQNKSPIEIIIKDSVIKIKYKIFKTLNYYRIYNLSRFNKSFKIKVTIKNNTNEYYNLYYINKDIYSVSYSYTKLIENDTLYYFKHIEEIPENKGFISQQRRKAYFNNLIGLRYVLIDSLTKQRLGLYYGDVWPNDWPTNLIDGINDLVFFPKKLILKLIKPPYSKPLILKPGEAVNKKFKIVITRNVGSTLIGKPGRLVTLNTNELNLNGIKKGTYYLFLYYWSYFNNEDIDFETDYFIWTFSNHTYLVNEEKHLHQYYILKDINSRKKGIPFEGYIKSNTIKVIVE